ncbi:MAG: hypothetical protein ACOYXN_10295 [Acidobacteriota bacterium]
MGGDGRLRLVAWFLALLWAWPLPAATYLVGPGRPYPNLQAVADFLNPGDVVEVDGNATYPGGVVFERPGSPEAKIVIRGIRVAGNRPVLSGSTNTVTFATPDPDTPEAGANHYVFEGFDVTGGSFRGLYHQAHDLTVRDVRVHHCPAHGILGADQGSGSLTLEHVEVDHCGNGTSQHQIYVATDEVHHPGSVFRMAHCYVHDGTGGNNVKSRAERNEIVSNWIEGAYYHELELIGPDPYGAPDGWSEGLVREDSDVVGNVLWKRNTFFVVRFGGDGTGQSNGRYRFVHNTVVAGTSAVFRIFDGIQSVEMHDNVFCRADGGAPNLLRTAEAEWTDGEQIAGRSNWVRTGSTNVPAQWTGTLYGTDPGLTDLGASDPRPLLGSPLRNAAATDLSGPPGFPFPDPEHPVPFHPPLHAVSVPGQESPRPFDCAPDIGAYEFPPAVAVVARLRLAQGGALSWDRAPGVSAYDVVKGDLGLLLSSGGDFGSSLLACLENDSPNAEAADGETPEVGGGFYYLVRGTPGGTYDSGCPGQDAPRDAEVAASPAACP